MPMITVPLGDRTYPIHIGSGMLDCLGAHTLEALGDISVAVVLISVKHAEHIAEGFYKCGGCAV